jgi:hypothetical protein
MSEARPRRRVAPMIPPRFLYEDGRDAEEERRRLVREEWRRVCASLQEAEDSSRVPFGNVRELRARVEELYEEHLEEARKRDRARDWRRYYDRLSQLCRSRMREAGVGLDDAVQDAAPQRFHEHRAAFEEWEEGGGLPRPAGKMNLSGIQGPGKPWAWSWKDGEATLSVKVPDATCESHGIDLDPLPLFRKLRFAGAQMWRSALGQIRERAQTPKQWEEEHDQRYVALRFRWGVRKNVLHQYETFGEIPPPPVQEDEGQLPPSELMLCKARAVLAVLENRGKNRFSSYADMQRRLDLNGLPCDVPTGEAVTKGARRAMERLGYAVPNASACWKAVEEARDEGQLKTGADRDLSGQI